MIDAARREIFTLSRDSVPPAELGEWNDVANSACFLLFRNTELYRGPMRILVISSREITARLFPEGTLVLSTGLLDYIDDEIFNKASESSRRIKDFSNEREALLIPFIAREAASFALDLPYRQWCAGQDGSPALSAGEYSSTLKPSRDDELGADRFALVLLSLAEYDPDSYARWLSSLEPKTEGLPATDTPIDRYRARYPLVSDRLDSIRASRTNISKITDEFAGLLSGIRTHTAFRESLSSVEALREIYPDSPYLARLEALDLHELWLSGIAPENTIFRTVLPLEGDTGYGAPLDAWYAPRSTAKAVYPQDRLSPPGDRAAFSNVLDAYNRALDISDDPLLESSFASVLVWSEKREDRKKALLIAAEAASTENGDAPFAARANYASILFLTGTDRQLALSLLEGLTTISKSPVNADTSSIARGIPGDGRDVLINLSLMYRLMGNVDKAAAVMNRTVPLTNKDGDAPIAWRRVHIGDSADDLVARWGEPDEISYNYYTESWTYRSLAAIVRVAETTSGSGRIVKAIKLGSQSPISPGGDVRVGDKRAEFEAVFGVPVWYANDAAVYFYRGNILSVQYLSGTIRSIRAEWLTDNAK